MKIEILNLLKRIPELQQVDTTLSMKPFVRFLKEEYNKKEAHQAPFYRYALKQIQDIPDWDKEISEAHIDAYRSLFDLVYYSFSTPMMEESKYKWALAKPLSPIVFYGTSAFYELWNKELTYLQKEKNTDQWVSDKNLKIVKLIYSFLLKKLYHFSVPLKDEIIQSHFDKASGRTKYYKVSFDTRFVDVQAKGALPKIDFSYFRLNNYDKKDLLNVLTKRLPLEKFHFEGFSVVQITDITSEYVLEHIKDMIVNPNHAQNITSDIVDSLKNLLDDVPIDVRLFPLLKVNKKLIRESLSEEEKYMDSQCSCGQFDKEEYMAAIEEYTQHPKIIHYPDIDMAKKDPSRIISFIKKTNIRSVVFIPIYKHKNLVGVLGLFSCDRNVLTTQRLVPLGPAIPLLEELLSTLIDDFNLTINNIIREKFTALQPSVQWRFNEVAWEYLQKKQSGKNVEIEEVSFEEVYPLYGSVDIRNSTIQRNKVLQADMQKKLNLLKKMLMAMKEKIDLGILDELLFKTGEWLAQVDAFISPSEEAKLTHFLEKEVAPFLAYFKGEDQEVDGLMEKYTQASSPEGDTFSNRRQLEESLKMMNSHIGVILDEMNRKIQEIYPCFFERFRSDGIEYDIYIGQSITPKKEFNKLYLKNLRIWQLSSMAEIARETHQLLPHMPKKLETTQLILVHSRPIDISFRKDEHRFDVEGAYNIRYEMVKKRIDKVHLKNSSERLTQPGKIAIVYFQEADIKDYTEYIPFMKEQGIIGNEVEHLELENLQGLTDLKAIRLTVNL